MSVWSILGFGYGLLCCVVGIAYLAALISTRRDDLPSRYIPLVPPPLDE